MQCLDIQNFQFSININLIKVKRNLSLKGINILVLPQRFCLYIFMASISRLRILLCFLPRHFILPLTLLIFYFLAVCADHFELTAARFASLFANCIGKRLESICICRERGG